MTLGLTDEEIQTIFRQAKRFQFAAEQDANPVIAFLHNSYSVALLDILNDISTVNEIDEVVKEDFVELRKRTLLFQNKLQEAGEKFAKEHGLGNIVKGEPDLMMKAGKIFADHDTGQITEKQMIKEIKIIIAKLDAIGASGADTLRRRIAPLEEGFGWLWTHDPGAIPGKPSWLLWKSEEDTTESGFIMEVDTIPVTYEGYKIVDDSPELVIRMQETVTELEDPRTSVVFQSIIQAVEQSLGVKP